MNPHFVSLVLGLAHQAESALGGSLPAGAEGAGDDQTLTALRFRYVKTAPHP